MCTVTMEYSSWSDVEGVNISSMRELLVQIKEV